MDAIVQAIGRQRIRYINPPASFEATGQKVRFPTEILEQRFATCLDLALLFAACCEQAGLHPLVLMHEGHAYAGCWVVGRTLAEPATDDQQLVRKLVDLEELAVCELTALTTDSPGTLANDALLGADETLRGFFGHEHDGRIHRFRELDERVRHLTRELVRARLAAGLPREETDDSLPAAELGLLRKEIGKKTRHLPVRQLLSRIATLMPRLKPCVLMSPLSVAQYLEAGRDQFDVVVFDEASQIPVWDAVGAIARGTQLVVVGDPKQLPPTNFFQRSDEGGDDELLADFDDLESILDKLRQAVLEGLGWKLHRIWATDWWHDPDGEMVRLQAAVEAAQADRTAAG